MPSLLPEPPLTQAPTAGPQRGQVVLISLGAAGPRPAPLSGPCPASCAKPSTTMCPRQVTLEKPAESKAQDPWQRGWGEPEFSSPIAGSRLSQLMATHPLKP